jgi:hypothetical protein
VWWGVVTLGLLVVLVFGWNKVLAAPCPKAQAVTEGTEVPCDGILIPAVDAKRALSCMTVELPDCLKTAGLDATQCEVDKTELKKARDAHQKRADVLDKRLAEVSLAPEVPWHEKPWFVAVASVVSTAVVAVAVWGIVEAAE